MALACALIAPLAFAQTSTTATETTTSTEGTVSTYKPGKRIVVRSEREDNPISYALGRRPIMSIKPAEKSTNI
jgi:hypothetical protein